MRLIALLILASFASAFQPQPSLKLPAQRLASNGSPEVSPSGRESSGAGTSKRSVGRVSLPFTRKVLVDEDQRGVITSLPFKRGILPLVAVLCAPLLLLSSLFGDSDGATYYYSSSSVSITSMRNPDGTIIRNIDRSSKVKTNVKKEALTSKPSRLMGDSIWLDVTNDFYWF